MQAVVKIGPTQYLVSPGQQIETDRLGKTEGDVVFDQVLLIIDGNETAVGQPTITGASVKAKVLGESRGEKVRTATYKAKSRYRKVKGFRPYFTKLQIVDVLSSASKTASPVETTPKTVSKTPKKASKKTSEKSQ